MLAKNLGGVDQGLRGLKLGLRMDDLGAAVAFRLGLLGDGADHVFGELDGPDLDIAHLDSPSFGLAVQDAWTSVLSFFRSDSISSSSCCPSTARSVVCASMLVAGR